MRKLHDERGIAMVTVLLVAAAMTAIASLAAFAAVEEFRSATDDRKASAAVSYAESGIDRFVQHIRSGTLTWGQLIRAGCEDPAMEVPDGVVGGEGSFEASLTVYNPYAATAAERLPIPPSGGACAPGARPTTPADPGFFAISSTGSHPAAKRIVRQVVEIKALGLPVGLAAQTINVNGDHDLYNISMFAEGQIVGRNKLKFTGDDPYYTLDDLWPGNTWPAGRSASDQAPAGVHSTAGIYLKPNASDPEFKPGASGRKNCEANKDAAQGNKQSLWDSDANGSGPITSGCTGEVGYPPDSSFTDADYARIASKRGSSTLDPYDRSVLKEAARTYGLYCYIPLAGFGSATCYRMGVPVAGFTSDWSPVLAAGYKHFVAYFEFQSGGVVSNNSIPLSTSVWDFGFTNGCNPDPALNQAGVIVVENGGAHIVGSPFINGALILDGNFEFAGEGRINGTVIANTIRMQGGSDISIDSCWVGNMPGPFLGATTVHWSEIDR
ncbi:MAG TPA: hypothetical protein VFS18_00155 [Actinomycetota bacterium]|nr:hypothetical protein [Actinomycetota bacterium]